MSVSEFNSLGNKVLLSFRLAPDRKVQMSASGATPVIRFDGVAKKYGSASILEKLDFEIAAGGFVGLVGVNGAGKTTLLKCLLDFCHLDSGRIDIFGQP